MENQMEYSAEALKQEAYEAVRELLTAAQVKQGGILVVGCSTSEVTGGVIGKASSPEAAEALYAGVSRAAAESGVFVAAQCCEHLNRAIVTEREAVALPVACGVLREVNVIPQPKAGGSFAAAAYSHAKDPVVLEHIAADCGIDIGGTLIGMHLKEVAVPLRLSVKTIGAAPVTAARTRAKFIGGSRAVYDEGKL